MTLKPCKECGREISGSDKYCSHCGKRHPASSFRGRRYGAASFLATLAWLNAGAALLLAAILLSADLPSWFEGLKWGVTIGFLVGALAWSALMILAVHASDDLRRLRESSE